MIESRPRPVRRHLLLGIVLGLVIGLPLGFLAGRPRHSNPWTDAGAAWMSLPQHQTVGQAPQTFTVPAKAYDYGATTEALSPLVSDTPSILRVDLTVTAGRVGVSLAKPDGSALVSKEKPVTPANGPTSVYFSVTPTTGPASILLRNYDDEGVPGAVTVNKVTVAPISGIGKKDLGEINRAGVN